MLWLMHELEEQYKFTHRVENKNNSTSWVNFNNLEILVSKKLYPYIMNKEISMYYYPEVWEYHLPDDEYYNLTFCNFIITDNPPAQTFLLCTDNKKLYSKLKILF